MSIARTRRTSAAVVAAPVARTTTPTQILAEVETSSGCFVLWREAAGPLGSNWIDPDGAGADAVPTSAARAIDPDLETRLRAWFAGDAVDLDDLETPPGPPFHRACWNACRRIPRGETRTYAELAALAGSPKASRAAGQAMRHNRLPVVIPCHRVVGSSGIGGFAGSDDPAARPLDRKRWLLALERTNA